MQPEISHRCASCGAAIREPAMFCPDCGKPLAKAAPEEKPQVVAETPAPAIANVPEAARKKLDPPAEQVARGGPYGKARDSLHRASTATRDALAENVKRVEKIRHVSSVVLGEATYDPSLRFALVALGAFVILLGLLQFRQLIS